MKKLTTLFDELKLEIHSIKNSEFKFKFKNDWLFKLEVLEKYVKYAKEDGMVISENIDDLLLIPNNLFLQWTLGGISGFFELSNIYDSVALDKSELDMFDDILDEREVSDETKEMFRKSRIIDYVESFGYTVIFKEDDGTYDLNSLWFMDEDELEFHKLNLDLETYYRTLLTVKGAYRWQYLFFNNSEGEGYYDSYSFETICRWIHVLPELFPNHDYSLVIQKFKEMIERDGEDEFGWVQKSIAKLKELGIWKF